MESNFEAFSGLRKHVTPQANLDEGFLADIPNLLNPQAYLKKLKDGLNIIKVVLQASLNIKNPGANLQCLNAACV